MPVTQPSELCRCGQPLKRTPRRKRPLCRSCSIKIVNADPERRAKSRATMKAKFEDPAFRDAHIARIKDGIRRALATRPEERQRRAVGAAIARRARREKFNAWCPLEYRAAYRTLRHDKGLRAAEARKLIEEQIAADRSRYSRTGRLQASSISA